MKPTYLAIAVAFGVCIGLLIAGCWGVYNTLT